MKFPIVTCVAFVVGLAIGVFSGILVGKSMARSELASTAADAVADLRKSDPLAASVLERSVALATDRNEQFESAVRLKKIGLALVIYGNSHGGNGPADLAALIKDADLDSADLKTRGGFQLVYNGARAGQKDDDIVAFEQPIDPAQRGKVAYNVLRFGGRVELIADEK